MSEPFELYAVKYATAPSRRRWENFYGQDGSDDSRMPVDYFVWAAVSSQHTVVIDAGFSAEVAARRNRTHLRCPTEALRAVGVDAGTVGHLVLSHFHYDHVGTVDRFGQAELVVQDAEMAFWTGRYAGRRQFRKMVEQEDIHRLVQANLDGRVRFADGDRQVVPGLSVHLVGGHTPGMQVVRVETARGAFVVGSDASHFYDNVCCDSPFSVVTDLRDMYRAFDVMHDLADAPEMIVPGHDPQLMTRYPAAAEDVAEIAVRIA